MRFSLVYVRSRKRSEKKLFSSSIGGESDFNYSTHSSPQLWPAHRRRDRSV